MAALGGLYKLRESLFTAHQFPPTRLAAKLRRRKTHTIRAGATLTATATLSARAQVLRRRPTLAEPMSEWVEYWDTRFANVEERVTWAQEDARERDTTLHDALTAETRERREADVDLERRMNTGFAGANGEGLTWAWWGLVAAIAGTVLQGIAVALG